MRLAAQPLTRATFARFGDVIETEGAKHFPINEGTVERYHDLALVEVAGKGGRPFVSIFVAQPWPQPIMLQMMERHPLGTQAFIPLLGQDFLVVVADKDASPTPQNLHAFRAKGTQGVNYHRNVWHHPLIALDADSRFLVIDRGGDENNLEEAMLGSPVQLTG